MKTGLIILSLAIGCSAALGQDEAGATLKTDKEKISYSIGMDIGRNLKRQQFDVDSALVIAGMEDVLNGSNPLLSQQEYQAALQSLREEIMARKNSQTSKDTETNKAAEATFLAKNRLEDGVEETESGLQYKVLTAGTGKTPKLTDRVKTHYRGTLLDGTEFDSSYRRGEPATFGVNQVIPGWTEALQLMKEGGKWKLFIPARLAYGAQAPPGSVITPHSMLIFDIELISIE